MPFIEKIRETVRKYGMLEKGDTVVAAVSGGIDSMAMLHALCGLRDEHSLRIIVCHLNHGLRGSESRRDFEFVKKASKKLGLKFEGKTLRPGSLKKPGASLQEAAREKRLKFLLDAAKKHRAARVATGHTRDDQAETLLMRLMKGSSLQGLAGIAPTRGIFIRPLIEATRREVAGFIKGSRIDYVVDSSNLGTEYLRNDVRMRLIPFIRENYNPGIVETLGRIAEILRRDEEFIDHIAGYLGILKTARKTVTMDRNRLLDLHPSLSTRVFLKAAEALGRRDALFSHHIDQFLKCMKGRRPNARLTLPGPLFVIREYDRVTLTLKRPAEAPEGFDVLLKVPGRTRITEAGCALQARILGKSPERIRGDSRTAYFDYRAIPGPVRARSFRPGDRLVPFGMKGRKKLKEIFIEGKIPAVERPRIPVLYAGGEILWVPTLKRSDHFKVTRSTKKVLEVKYLKTP